MTIAPVSLNTPLIEQTLEEHPRLRAARRVDLLTARGDDGSVVQLRRYACRGSWPPSMPDPCAAAHHQRDLAVQCHGHPLPPADTSPGIGSGRGRAAGAVW
ncbi:hypothetical protein WME75_27750 [Sorangium sp. So ce1014]|uniref:hypothetical protein n=1 Tax=Sorangium sp. So ce1014 TaxID=3133326 RepID=UPI003F62D8EB